MCKKHPDSSAVAFTSGTTAALNVKAFHMFLVKHFKWIFTRININGIKSHFLALQHHTQELPNPLFPSTPEMHSRLGHDCLNPTVFGASRILTPLSLQSSLVTRCDLDHNLYSMEDGFFLQNPTRRKDELISWTEEASSMQFVKHSSSYHCLKTRKQCHKSSSTTTMIRLHCLEMMI